MNSFTISLALTCAVILSGCAATSELAVVTTPPQSEAARGVATLSLVGARVYEWRGHQYPLAELGSALSSESKTHPIQRVVLLDDAKASTTVADVIDVAMLAKRLGAVAFLEKDGELKSITFEVKD